MIGQGLALHGFMGNSSQFDGFKAAGLNLYALDLLPYSHLNIEDVAVEVMHKYPEPDFVLAYSMGARLALQLFEVARWQCPFVLISCNPLGLQNIEVGPRLEWESDWVKKFLDPHLDFKELNRLWNQLDIFSDKDLIHPLSQDRTQLAQQLINWSVRFQKSSLKTIQLNSNRFIFVYGQMDQKYQVFANVLVAETSARVYTIPSMGHRFFGFENEILEKLNKDFQLRFGNE